ncbi:MAG: histidine kinase [Pseudomonadota bacterium]|nr:histidine kinase [Pseudomonadota bacterium]
MTKLPDNGKVPALEQISARVEQISARNEQLLGRMIEGEKRFRGLAKSVWKVQEEERRRLARELHDGIGQTLTALINQLRRVPVRADGYNDLEAAIHVAELALTDVRELSRLLRPPVLDDLGLHAGLTWLARMLREHSGLATVIEWQAGEEVRLDPELETLVFRIAQEGLNNVLKHSGQLTARLAVRRHGDSLELTVADSGHGFDAMQVLSPAAGAAGLGLRGIRDRVELFGGQFAIDSAPGRGSRLRVVVPVTEARP